MLLSNLNLLATAPGGVARLRELILTLAVQGKLVPQDPADEPASELLLKIRAEKNRLIAEGKIKRDKPVAEIPEEEKSFDLPLGWEWVRLPEIYYSISPSGSKLLSSAVEPEGAYPVVDQGQRAIAGYTNDQALLIEIPGPVIIFGDHTKAIKHVNFDFVAGADGTKILRPVQQDEKFFAYQLRSFKLEDRGYARHFKVLNSHLFALPPLAEQSRIVTRVEELMRLCDALEAKGQLEATQHAQLLSTLLGTLTASATPDELAENWQRVAQHFDLLLDRPQAIDALEQTLLQLAVRGLLVPQDPTDEPASALLQKIRLEKDRLIAEGKIKRDKPLAPISEDETPFEVPVGWEWVRLGSAAKKITDGTHHSPANFPTGDFMYLSAKNIKTWGIDLSSATFIPRAVHDEIYARCDPEFGDILYIKDGATTGILTVNTIREPFSLLSSVGVIKPSCGLTSDYMSLVMHSPFFYQAMRDGMSGVAITRVTLSKLGDAKFPLPPLSEQSRIVSRVESLRRLCADLRQRLADRETVQAQLANALVHSTNSIPPTESMQHVEL